MSAAVPGAALQSLAARLLAGLSEGSPDLREAALLSADGSQLASTDGGDWSAEAAALWRATDAAGGGVGRTGASPDQVHVATSDGDVFSVRDAEAVVVATSDRFALASLMLCDLRAVLRGLHRGGG